MRDINLVAKQVLENCNGCSACVSDCEFLKRYGFPKQLAEIFQNQLEQVSQIAYSCNLCGLCAKICPEKIDTGKLCMAAREQLVDDGKALRAEHQAVKRIQDFAASESFRLVQRDPRTGRCERVFFPGCSLPGYAPNLVVQSYQYLHDRLPDTGIILGCCGGPIHFLGEREAFRNVLADIEDDMRRLGAHELIVACPDCSKTMKENLPQMQITSIYEVMADLGLPEGLSNERWKFSINDSCTARHQPSLRESVRLLIREMGHEIEEVEYSGEKARCCGMGGMVPFLDFDLAGDITKRRTDEFNFDVVSYCAGCREALAMNKASLHLLDLIFNPYWKEARHQAIKTGKKRREAQVQTKALLVELFQKTKSTERSGT